jgi:hypothetical protein
MQDLAVGCAFGAIRRNLYEDATKSVKLLSTLIGTNQAVLDPRDVYDANGKSLHIFTKAEVDECRM